VVTTNHKEYLDPALLRPGRMDMHIHMSYCTPCAFKTLASNYLRITNHSRFHEINSLLEEGMVTPAEVAEQLMRNEDTDEAIEDLVEFLQEKKKENEEAEAKRIQAAEQGGEEEEENAENVGP
jgi:mitochondrial chaperone BCS1